MENSKTFTEEDSEFLVEVVKEAQKRKIVGAHGLWHHYLIQVVDKNPRAAKDPAKRPWHVLAGFLASFTREEDKQVRGAELLVGLVCFWSVSVRPC